MNIFFLSISVRRCAKYHFDKHVVKMILEYAQLLSTAWHILDEDMAKQYHEEEKIYKKTHYNHPSAKWVREHLNNYRYVSRLALELCKEWRSRYGHPRTKLHASEKKLLFLHNNPPKSIPVFNIKKSSINPKCFTLPAPQAMHDECKYKPAKKSFAATIIAYRRYYQSEHKAHICQWTIVNKSYKQKQKRICLEKPYWFD